MTYVCSNITSGSIIRNIDGDTFFSNFNNSDLLPIFVEGECAFVGDNSHLILVEEEKLIDESISIDFSGLFELFSIMDKDFVRTGNGNEFSVSTKVGLLDTLLEIETGWEIAQIAEPKNSSFSVN